MTRYDSRRGGILFGLLLSALGVVCLLVFAGLFVARNVRVETAQRNSGDYVSIDTPVGHLSVNAHDKTGWASSEIPVYPGAHNDRDSGGSAVVEWTSANGRKDKGFSVAASEMITPDSAGQVLNYYREQLPSWVVVNERDGEVRLELREGGYKRFIVIHEKHDGTHIGVASVGEPASN